MASSSWATGNNKRGLRGFRADTTVVDADGVPIPVQLVIQDAVTLQTLRSSSAQAVSADGTIIAGFGSTKKANRAFVTTVRGLRSGRARTSVSTILPMLGGGKFAEAYAMTPDGAIIAGRSDSPKGPQACIWFQDDTDDVGGQGTGRTLQEEPGQRGDRHRLPARVGGRRADRRGLAAQTILYPSEAFVWTGNPVAGGRRDRLHVRPGIHPHQDRCG